MATVKLKSISKSFRRTRVLENISLDIADGEFTVLVGPSGCGKTTLLRLIAGLERADQGTISIAENSVDNLPPAQRRIAMVFQSYALYPHMNVRRNMTFGLKLAGMSKTEMNARVVEAARMLELNDLLHRKPAQLSGGQRQRVAIARAIVRKPDVFLFDEPLSNLDAALRVNTRIEIAKLHQALKTTIIYVTHDQVEAMTLADRMVVMNHGRIEQVGQPLALYRKPANLFVAGFIGSPRMNFFTGKIAARFDAHTIGIRPEHIEVTQRQSGRSGKIVLTEHLGSDTVLHIATETIGTVVAKAPGDCPWVISETIYLSFNPVHVHRFDEAGNSF